MNLIMLYGPPGSGKSAVGIELAHQLGCDFHDLDVEIESRVGMSIPEIFAESGEDGFREWESTTLAEMLKSTQGVLALGGGTLLDPRNAALASDAGQVILLTAPVDALHARLQGDADKRPLLEKQAAGALEGLLEQRADHYRGFDVVLDTSVGSIEDLAWQAQALLGRFRMRAMGEDCLVQIAEDGFDQVGPAMAANGLCGPAILVADSNTGPLYAERVGQSIRAAGYQVETLEIPAGEEHKTVAQIQRLWDQMAELGVERGSTLVALGGGVVGDMVGFAAATYLRGMAWVNLPTSLLAMVDASIGGKTGVNLARGKNLVGAFHAPRMVWVDPVSLITLPARHFRNGMAEVFKHAVIADPGLLSLAPEGVLADENRKALIQRAMAVKIQIVEQDPYEQGRREALNLGHTLGHAFERASHYRLLHGEAVAIGMVMEARLSEALGLAEKGLADAIRDSLSQLGLPVRSAIPTDDRAFLEALQVDKKRKHGTLRFSLPIRMGQVAHGVIVENVFEVLRTL